jgi:hypothetical protein
MCEYRAAVELNDTDGEKPNDSEKALSQCPHVPACPTLSTINTTWTALGSNPGLRGENSVTNRLSYGTAKDTFKSSW